VNIDLRSLASFGDVAAEDDSVLKYFLSTNAVQRIQQDEAFLVLGRKGSGKTAIVRYFTESPEFLSSRALNLRGYPWNVHASRIDRGASEAEAYVASWRYLISVEIASLALRHDPSKRNVNSKSIDKFFHDNYGGVEPGLKDILRPPKLKLGKMSFMPAIMGNQIGGVDLDRSDSNLGLGRELDAISSALLDASINLCKEANIPRLMLHIDELDQGLSSLDRKRSEMIVGLILAAREIRRDSRKKGACISPVVYLRSDLWSELEFSDKNKISQTQALHLEWSSDSLLSLVEARLKAELHSNATWDLIAESDLMRGSQTKWNHIVSRTFLRPRDVIRFLNAALAVAKNRSDSPLVLTNKDIIAARDPYSAYLKAELDDEILPHWQQWSEALQACSGIATMTFDKEQFTTEYAKRQTGSLALSDSDALRMLYQFSVLGYEKRSGYGGTSWVFQYTDPEVGWDSSSTRFKVHLGLKEYARLREERK
jgi:hypothetical protein